jgi:hypothetical protein
MARIRSVKPEFFRHKGIQILERDNPGQYPMLVFEGLWTACDKQGVFIWDNDYLHLDILPFIQFDFERTMDLLEASGYVVRFQYNQKQYGYIPSFLTHQRISGEEAKTAQKYPSPPQESAYSEIQKQDGSRSEAGRKQVTTPIVLPCRPGNGIIRKGKGEGEDAQAREDDPPPGFVEDIETGFQDDPQPSDYQQLIDAWNAHPEWEPCQVSAEELSENPQIVAAMQRWTVDGLITGIKRYAPAYAHQEQYESGTCPWNSLESFLAGKAMNRCGPKGNLETYRRKTAPPAEPDTYHDDLKVYTGQLRQDRENIAANVVPLEVGRQKFAELRNNLSMVGRPQMTAAP